MLSAAVDDRLLAQYADTSAFQVLVYDARHLLPQSRVTFQVRPQDGRFLINGALGLDYVTITYLRDTRLEATAYLDNNATTAMSKRSRSSTNSGCVQRMHCVGCGNSIQRASGCPGLSHTYLPIAQPGQEPVDPFGG